jgi:hypothetical protein
VARKPSEVAREGKQKPRGRRIILLSRLSARRQFSPYASAAQGTLKRKQVFTKLIKLLLGEV